MAIEEDPPQGVPEWVVSFGDMMSLLLTFFIMLVSMSEVKKDERFQAIVDSLREQFGDSMALPVLESGELRPSNGRVSKLQKVAKQQREAVMRGNKVTGPKGDFDRVEVIRPGKRSGVGVVIYFNDADAVLTDEAREKLQQFNEEIAGKPQKIEIRGHASLRPLEPGSPFSDHWELAYARALAVMRCLRDDLGVDPHRLRVSSAGANEPIVTRISPNEKGPQNARVEVMVLEEVVADLRVEDQFTAPPAEVIEKTANLKNSSSSPDVEAKKP